MAYISESIAQPESLWPRQPHRTIWLCLMPRPFNYVPSQNTCDKYYLILFFILNIIFYFLIIILFQNNIRLYSKEVTVVTVKKFINKINNLFKIRLQQLLTPTTNSFVGSLFLKRFSSHSLSQICIFTICKYTYLWPRFWVFLRTPNKNPKNINIKYKQSLYTKNNSNKGRRSLTKNSYRLFHSTDSYAHQKLTKN